MTETAPTPRRPFHETLGIELVSAQNGSAELRLPGNPGLTNSRGDVHGGAIAGLIDAALAVAARSTLPSGSGVATISYTTTFMEVARGTITAIGTVLRAGQTVITVEAKVVDQAGRHVAHALGTMRALRPLPP